MESGDIDILLEQIKETINASSDGSLSLEKTRTSYKKLLSEYNALEKKYISKQTSGFLKGLLYHHNVNNSATLSAIYMLRHETLSLIAFAGDRIVLGALPELINREIGDLEISTTKKVKLGEQGGQPFSLFLSRIAAGRETIVAASVTSMPLFNSGDFEFLAQLLREIYLKNREIFSPVMLNYIHRISSEISRVFNFGKEGAVYADHFFLYNPPGAFARIGIYNIIDFSNFIVDTLKKTYPPGVHIYGLSLSNYIVLYDTGTKQGLDIKRNRIDFTFHGNNIPYKVQITEIDSPQTMYLFLESL
jgi:hypothetical protein